MQLIISGKNLEVSDWLRDYVEKKIGKLDRYLSTLTDARVELSVENTRKVAQSQIVQATLHSNGTILRGEERSADFTAAIDAVAEKLHKQIERYKGKRARGRSLGERAPLAPEKSAETETPAPQIVRTKRFHTPPMTEDEAIEQMELLGHSFFIFTNREHGTTNVLYRRNDGNYGLIQLEKE